ncbi:hypothetical protein C8Q79DRAFT_333388 [Trametes meyenii]|nr:hypothetical protein C8Q79DRAFT_333388 [Trametes meyenii]
MSLARLSSTIHSPTLDTQADAQPRAGVRPRRLSLPLTVSKTMRNFFASTPSKAKASQAPTPGSAPPSSSTTTRTRTRPVISRPRPLERRVPTSVESECGSYGIRDMVASHDASVEPARKSRKRYWREASEPDGDEGKGMRRAASRMRLDSSVSGRARDVDESAPEDAAVARPLKSALKTRAREREREREEEVATRTHKALLSPRPSYARRKEPPLEGTVARSIKHNGASGHSGFVASSKQARGASDNAEAGAKDINTTPFPSSPHIATHGTPRHRAQKKTVTFADEHAQDTSMGRLQRTPTMRDLSGATEHWDDLTDELELEVGVACAAPSRRHTRAGQRRSRDDTDTRSSTPPTPVLAYKPLPDVLSSSARAAKAVVEADAREHTSFRALLAHQAPPTPEAALRAAPFKMPTSTSAVRDAARDVSADKENRSESSVSSAEGALRQMLKDIARDGEERECSRTAPARTFVHKPMDSIAVLKRFTVDIVPGARHTTIWDGNDGDTYTWSGTLQVRDTKPACYFYPRHSIQAVWIQFYVAKEPRTDPTTFDPTPALTVHEWQATYTGTRLPSSSSSSSPTLTSSPSNTPALDPARGIAVDPTYRLDPARNPDPDGPCTWTIRFCVPVPLRLFARAEHRTFVCRAQVTVGDWETPRTVVKAGCCAVGIERLRAGRLLGVGGA